MSAQDVHAVFRCSEGGELRDLFSVTTRVLPGVSDTLRIKTDGEEAPRAFIVRGREWVPPTDSFALWVAYVRLDEIGIEGC